VTAASSIARVAEQRLPGDVPLWVHPGWAERFPWLVQGTTGSGAPSEPYDLGLSGEQPVGRILERWRTLRGACGLPSAVHARQVHGTGCWRHRAAPAPGLLVMAGVDGHLTDVEGLLLTVSVADCVPIFLVDAERAVVALLHGGWRGVAGGILDRALHELRYAYSSDPAALWMHCGPAICGRCYEVGPEVHRAVQPGAGSPASAAPLDLRAALVERAAGAGIPAEQCTVSSHCTRCGQSAAGANPTRHFFSHRAGEIARQMAILGLRRSGADGG
jgi:polyphenol oxidase